MVTRKEKIRRLKVVRYLVENDLLRLADKELEDKAKAIAAWVKNLPPTNTQLAVACAAYLSLSPEERTRGDEMRRSLILAARKKF